MANQTETTHIKHGTKRPNRNCTYQPFEEKKTSIRNYTHQTWHTEAIHSKHGKPTVTYTYQTLQTLK